MSNIVFFCIPAHGHTNPTLGVVRELIARGHRVWYYSFAMMREKIEATGATFIPCDAYDTQQHLQPQDAARLGKDLAFSTKILTDTTLALDDKLCAEMEQLQPDCIVADSMAVWGKAIALKLGIPFVCSTTTFAFNRHSATVMKQTPGELLKMLLSLPRISKQIRRLQAKGYPVKNVLDLIGSDENTPTVVFTSPHFQPQAETFSAKFAFVGPSIRPATEQICKTRERLIYISMGTVNNALLPLYQNCIAALQNCDAQVIMSIGSQLAPDALGPLPPHISVFPQVDQIAVLQQADAFISHCGMNSASESLYFGVPLVMLPQTTEQKGVAARVQQLGAGVLPDADNAAALHRAVETVLQDESYRANAQLIGAGFRHCPGAAGAADKIEQVCRGEC